MIMSTVTVCTLLDAPPHAVWRAVTTPAGFRFVTRGLVELSGLDEQAADASWQPGATVSGRLRVLGVPFSHHRITLESIDHERRRLQSDEGGGPIRSWRHLIEVEAAEGDDTRCRYTDTIEIRAGVLTPAIAAFAHVFYRLRQRRWRRLAPVLAALTTDAHGWLARHETAFNSGAWDDVLDDYTADAVLEAHLDGQRMAFTGVAAIHEALQMASAAGVQTRVARAVADDRTVAALITDVEGEPYMVSFWHLTDGRIARDVSIVVGRVARRPA
jgi:ligand-binding SRPBCC domain-containing protein